MVTVFAGQDMGQQTGARHAALNRAFGGTCLANAFAFATRVFGSHVVDGFDAARLVVQDFRDVLPDGA